MIGTHQEPSDALAGRTAFISGASRGIGREIAKTLARAGANIALIAKTDKPNPKLPGTIQDAAEELRGLGADVLAIAGDIRDEARVAGAVARTMERFGGIDLCVNNASALNLADVGQMPNQAPRPPAVGQRPRHVRRHPGLPAAAAPVGARPRPHPLAPAQPRPELVSPRAVHHLQIRIVADAAAAILRRNPTEFTGNAVLVEDVLAEEGITDLRPYSAKPGQDAFFPDFFVDPAGLDRPTYALPDGAETLRGT